MLQAKQGRITATYEVVRRGFEVAEERPLPV
jgi:hypothetical protein